MNLLQKATERLPALGIVAFSLCSINSVANLFLARARNPTPVLWLAAGLVEIVTAWIVYQAVEMLRKVTKSNISKQDRKFYSLVLAMFVVLAIPPLGLSVTANALEFGDKALGCIFPLLSVACAIGSALPQTVQKFEKGKEDARAEAAKAKERKRKERERKAKASQAQAQQELVKRLASLGNAEATLRQYVGNPGATQASVAQALGISRQAVGHHLKALEQAELIERNGQGVQVLIELD